MTRIVPEVPGCTVTGYLYDSNNPVDLGQDMVEVMGTNGVTVDAGWVPEGDPNGAYQIAVCQGMKHLRPIVSTRDIHECARYVVEYAELYCVSETASQGRAPTGTNRFGYRIGSGAQRLSEAVDSQPRTTEEIVERAGHPRGAVRQHLDDMVTKGFVVKEVAHGVARYRLCDAYTLLDVDQPTH